MSDLSINVNNDRLIGVLENAFTDRMTWVGELLQNARRAGASAIEVSCEEDGDTLTVSVIDNGHGVQDWQAMLTLAETGWSQETQEEEQPFGLGFMAALFQARHILVASNGQQFSAASRALLNGGNVTLESSERRQGTEVRLAGLEQTRERFEGELAWLVRGFPVPITLNGQPLGRPLALDGELSFASYEAGHVSVNDRRTRDNFVVFLQGLPIQGQRRWFSFIDDQCPVVHLDSKAFRARMPDRAELVDAPEALARIRKSVQAAWRDYFVALKARLDPSAFAGLRQSLADTGCLDLLNDVPVVPPDVLARVGAQDLVLDENADLFLENLSVSETITREDIERGKVRLVSGRAMDDWTEEDDWPAVRLYAYAAGALVVSRLLDDGHWIWQHLDPALESEPKIEVTPVCPGHEHQYRGTHLFHLAFTLCESLRVKGPWGEFTVTDWGWIDSGSYRLMLPYHARADIVASVVSFFDGEFERLEEGAFEVESGTFARYLDAVRQEDDARALAVLMDGDRIKDIAQFQGKTFTLRFADGTLTIEAA